MIHGNISAPTYNNYTQWVHLHLHWQLSSSKSKAEQLMHLFTWWRLFPAEGGQLWALPTSGFLPHTQPYRWSYQLVVFNRTHFMSQVPPRDPIRQELTQSLSTSLCLWAQAAAHAIPVDLLMDLIAFQLIAPHASTKLNQTEVPSTSLIANLILLDIIIRWYWLVMTQHFQDRRERVCHASQRGLWQAVHFRSCKGSRCFVLTDDCDCGGRFIMCCTLDCCIL